MIIHRELSDPVNYVLTKKKIHLEMKTYENIWNQENNQKKENMYQLPVDI